MNRVQLTVLWASIGLIALACLCPPWSQTFQAEGVRSTKPLGHALLFEPPEPPNVAFGVQIDAARLGVIVGGIAVVAAGLILTLQTRPTAPPTPCTPPTPSALAAPPALDDADRPEDPANSSASRSGPVVGRSAFWLLIALGVLIHVVITCGTDADSVQYIGEASRGTIMVFLLGCLGSYAAGLIRPSRGTETAGCTVGVMTALAITLSSAKLPSDHPPQSTQPPTVAAPAARAPATPASARPVWEDWPIVSTNPLSFQPPGKQRSDGAVVHEVPNGKIIIHKPANSP